MRIWLHQTAFIAKTVKMYRPLFPPFDGYGVEQFYLWFR